ncbi:hypothetical protein Glove_197g36 [Diversispora epigaea]|uniref:Uncharacterized protein n=1 Tax=Diversispora epigaea TaxID=1348612 RepID=A0A397IQA4_9GLOM|nr:hypothetical protein Glove_197g36 [Diversispora epigaea]
MLNLIKDILAIANKAFTILEYCGKSIDVVDEGSRRDSVSSQISKTSTLVNEFNHNIEINSPRTSSQGQLMDLDKNEETDFPVILRISPKDFDT